MRSLIGPCAILACAASASAQDARTERREFDHMRGDVWHVLTSPARAHGRDLAIAGGSAVAVVTASTLDRPIAGWLSRHQHSAAIRALAPLREGFPVPFYEMGSAQGLLPVAAVAYIAGRASGNDALRDVGLGCAAGQFANFTTRFAVYHLVARTRPEASPSQYDIGVPGSSDWMRQSFTSGHISNSMACASFIHHRYQLGAVEAVPFVYSIAIGLGRMSDGHHWTSDTMAGAIIGYAIGRELAHLQLQRTSPRTTAAATKSRPSLPVVALRFVF